jgi:hypothetical protein
MAKATMANVMAGFVFWSVLFIIVACVVHRKLGCLGITISTSGVMLFSARNIYDPFARSAAHVFLFSAVSSPGQRFFTVAISPDMYGCDLLFWSRLCY